MNPSDDLVTLRDLDYSYPEGKQRRIVLHGLCGEIRRGEYVALLGQSGSGKSTLLNLIAGLDVPQAGEILIDGVTLNRLGETDRTLFRRKHIGCVYQFFNLLPTLTVAENIMLPLELNRASPAARQRALRLLDEVGLGDRAESFPDQLSGGEQQRVAIVRTLAHDPPLVLADEPTGNLDAKSGEHILALFDRIIRAQNKTLLLVTHNRDVAARADRMVYLRDGRLSVTPA
jgi:putative ABC transport system ATP-binding protein